MSSQSSSHDGCKDRILTLKRAINFDNTFSHFGEPFNHATNKNSSQLLGIILVWKEGSKLIKKEINFNFSFNAVA